MKEKIKFLMNRFKDDPIMLDAIYQWASNSTSESAVVRLNRFPNHGLIKKNLKLRYDLKEKEAEEIYNKLIKEIESIGLKFSRDFVYAYVDVNKYLNENDILKNEVINRLKSASENEKYITWFFCKLLEKHDWMRMIDILERLDLDFTYVEKSSNRFEPFLNATFNIHVKTRDVIFSLIKLGFLNELQWVNSAWDKSWDRRNKLLLPDYLKPIVKNIDNYISLPKPPDFKKFIDDLFEKKQVEALIGLEELLANGWIKKQEMTGKIIPEPFIIGESNDILALNLRIYEQLKEYFFEKKNNELKIANDIDIILNQLIEKYYPELSFEEKELFKGAKVWDIYTMNPQLSEKDIRIIHTPWLIGKQIDTLRNDNSKMYVIILFTMMGIPQFNNLYRKMYHKEIVKENFYWIILDATKDKIFDMIINNKPKLYEEIINELGKKYIFAKKETSVIKDVDYSNVPFEVSEEILIQETSHIKAGAEKQKVSPLIDTLDSQPNKLSVSDEIIIGSDKIPDQWGIIGKTKDSKVVKLDLNAPHIVFVSGMMGAGKGYTIGVISEMLVSNSIPSISKVSKKATVIVLYKPRDDVPSEFWSIRYKNDVPNELKKLKEDYNTEPFGIIKEDDFKVFVDSTAYKKYKDDFSSEYKTSNIYSLYIDPSTLISDDWANALAAGGSNDTLYIKEIFRILRDLPRDFGLSQVYESVEKSNLTKNQKKFAKQRLEILKEYLQKDDFMSKLAIGGVNIFDFRKAMYTPDDIFTIMTLIISKLQNKKEFENEPFVFIINEAHMYFNKEKGLSKEFTDTIENLIRRKRHGANWLLLDTHLPNDVDPKIIQLSDIKVLHFSDKTIESPILKKIVEGTPIKLYELSTGECIISSNISSEGASKPIFVRIRPRITKHGAATKTAIK